jgi:hypothetical protein
MNLRRPTREVAAELIADIEHELRRLVELQHEQARLIDELTAQLSPGGLTKPTRPRPRPRLHVIPGGRSSRT